MFETHQFIAFGIDDVDTDRGRYRVIFGQLQQPGATVEVQLGDQQIVRDNRAGNMTLLIMPQASSLDELRVVNQQGEVIEHVNLRPQLSGG